MRPLLLLLVLLLPGVLPARAQTPPAGPVLADAPAAPDTAAAIHRLFKARRKQRLLVGITGALAFGAEVAVAVSPTTANSHRSSGSGIGPSGPLLNDQALTAASIVILVIPAILAEVLGLGGWNQKREQRTIEAWQQHRLKPHLKRQLKPRFF